MESWTGLGLMMGPPLGSLFKLMFGGSYGWPFYIQALLFAIFIIPTVKLLPPDSPSGKGAEKKTLPMGKVFMDGRIFTTFLLIVFGAAGLTWVNPVFSVHLSYYGVSESWAAIILSSGTVTYIISLNIVPRLTKLIDKPFALSFGLIMGVVSDLILGPEKYLGLPNVWAMDLIGIMFCGIAQGFCILPFIPQMMEVIVSILPEAGHLAGDMAAGLFMGGYAGGQFFGPIIGGLIFDIMQKTKLPDGFDCTGKITDAEFHMCAVADEYAFLNCSRVFAVTQLIVFVLFMIFAGGAKSWAGVCKGKRRSSSGKKKRNINNEDTFIVD